MSGHHSNSASPGTRDEPSPGTHNMAQHQGGGHHPSWPPGPSGGNGHYSNHHGYYDGPPHQQQMMYPYSPAGQPSSDSGAYTPNPPHPKGPLSSSSSSTRPDEHSSSLANKANGSNAAADFKGSRKDNDKSKKALAKAWTQPEDDHLLDLVLQMKHPLKWSIIAQSLVEFSEANNADTPERTGKQCRERYVNHLNPRLKHSEFTPTEDATIWRLFATIGSQWAKMSKVIPGRTDNNLKNRFHNLKRQLQREEDGRLRAPTPEDYGESVHEGRVRDIPTFLRTRIEDMWKYKRNIGAVAAGSAHVPGEDDAIAAAPAGGDAAEKDNANANAAAAAADSTTSAEVQRVRKFGPYETVTEPRQCGRCGLFMPSVQCGTEMCTKTKWCRVCTRVSMHLGGSVLRECVNLRKCRDGEIVTAGLGRMLEDTWNGK